MSVVDAWIAVRANACVQAYDLLYTRALRTTHTGTTESTGERVT